MTLVRRPATFSVLIVPVCATNAYPCTTFVLENDGKPVFGRNYDWSVEDGLVMVNKRHVQKTAAVINILQDTPATWVSKYGSVTFNQGGREFPCGGMNEAGLVVEVLVLNCTEYSVADSRPSIDCVQWIQCQLDNYATVQEVTAHANDLRIRSDSLMRVHYLVADKTGDAAAIEVLAGKVVCHTPKAPLKVLTNDTYEGSTDF